LQLKSSTRISTSPLLFSQRFGEGCTRTAVADQQFASSNDAQRTQHKVTGLETVVSLGGYLKLHAKLLKWIQGPRVVHKLIHKEYKDDECLTRTLYIQFAFCLSFFSVLYFPFIKNSSAILEFVKSRRCNNQLLRKLR